MSESVGNSPQWIAVARILRPQGRRGEVLAELLTDFPEKLIGREGLHLLGAGTKKDAASQGELRECVITESWLPKGKNEGRIVLTLHEVDSIDAAETLSGWELVVRPEDRVALEDGAAYVSDLTGCTLLDGERTIGLVRDVHFPTTADGRRRLEQASPLLVVETAEGDELLIPFVREYLRDLDTVRKVVRMELPTGLVDLNDGTAEAGSEAAGKA